MNFFKYYLILVSFAACFRSDPSNPNEAILVWGDTGGSVNAIHFTSANIALFERPAAPAGEKQGNYKMVKNIFLDVNFWCVFDIRTYHFFTLYKK